MDALFYNSIEKFLHNSNLGFNAFYFFLKEQYPDLIVKNYLFSNKKHNTKIANHLFHRLLDELNDDPPQPIEHFAKFLLDNGADYTYLHPYDETNILYSAVWTGNFNLVQLFLNYNQNVNLQDKDGWSPIICSCIIDNPPITQLLLNHNANPFLTDINNKNSFSLCALNASFNCLNLLLQTYPIDNKQKLSILIDLLRGNRPDEEEENAPKCLHVLLNYDNDNFLLNNLKKLSKNLKYHKSWNQFVKSDKNYLIDPFYYKTNLKNTINSILEKNILNQSITSNNQNKLNFSKKFI